MEALTIEILDPKAMKLIEGMQDLNLIKVSPSPLTQAEAYLKKMRQSADRSPDLDEIAQVVAEVRTERYDQK